MYVFFKKPKGDTFKTHVYIFWSSRLYTIIWTIIVSKGLTNCELKFFQGVASMVGSSGCHPAHLGSVTPQNYKFWNVTKIH
jgi:hypothetical protein